MLDANRVGCTLGLTFAAIYALCSLFFITWPQGFMATTGVLFHGFALDPSPHSIGLIAFVCSILGFALLGYLAGALFALIFNRFGTTLRPVQAPQRIPR